MANIESKTLPTRAEFLEQYLHVLEKCAICLESFTEIHRPAQIRTAKCQHVFGQSCLLTWMESSQTCPLCRTQLFVPNVPNFVQGSRLYGESHQVIVNHCSSHEDAQVYVETLWWQLWQICDKNEIFDSDIAEKVSKTTQLVTSGFSVDYRICYSGDEWLEILWVVQEMIKMHFANGKFRSCEPELEVKWIPMMSFALGWNVDTASEAEDSDYDYEEDSESDSSE